MPPSPAGRKFDERWSPRLNRLVVEPAFQVIGQGRRGGVPLARRFGHRLEYDGFELRRNMLVICTRRPRLLLDDSTQYRMWLVAGNRRFQREQFIQRDAERINVCPMVQYNTV